MNLKSRGPIPLYDESLYTIWYMNPKAFQGSFSSVRIYDTGLMLLLKPSSENFERADSPNSESTVPNPKIKGTYRWGVWDI